MSEAPRRENHFLLATAWCASALVLLVPVRLINSTSPLPVVVAVSFAFLLYCLVATFFSFKNLREASRRRQP